MSPYGKVPAVVMDDGKVLYESAIINEYLDEVYPEVRLMPEDPYQRAQVRIWTDFAASRLVPPLYRVRKSTDPEKVKASWPELHKELAFLDRHLKSTEGPWFLGGKFTLADINFLPFAAQIENLEGDVLGQYPAIKGWLEAFKDRPTFGETLQDT